MPLTLSPSDFNVYEPRVSSDNFDNKDASDFSFTLRSKHRHYTYKQTPNLPDEICEVR